MFSRRQKKNFDFSSKTTLTNTRLYTRASDQRLDAIAIADAQNRSRTRNFWEPINARMRGYTRVLRGDLVLNTRCNGRQRSGTIIKKHKIKKTHQRLSAPSLKRWRFRYIVLHSSSLHSTKSHYHNSRKKRKMNNNVFTILNATRRVLVPRLRTATFVPHIQSDSIVMSYQILFQKYFSFTHKIRCKKYRFVLVF